MYIQPRIVDAWKRYRCESKELSISLTRIYASSPPHLPLLVLSKKPTRE
jgi:hypothetical protein